MKKFSFQTDIIRRKKLNKSALFYGLIGAALLGYAGMSYLDMGLVPLIEKLIAQIGIGAYSMWVYLAFVAICIMMVLPAIRTLLQKKVSVGGQVSFDEENLKIVRGREKYVIPGSDLNHMQFNLKALPSGEKKDPQKLFGGSYMTIPTKKGAFQLELNIDSNNKKEELLEMIEFLKIEHDVKVKVKEEK